MNPQTQSAMMNRLLVVGAMCPSLLFGQGAFTDVASPKPAGNLEYVESVSRPDLATVNWLVSSPDGKFLYSAAWSLGSLNVFQRNPVSGKLGHTQNITDRALLAGSTGLGISPNGRYALATAFEAQNAVLFARDAKEGTLRQLDYKHNGADGVDGLAFAVHAVFSPDSKFAYIANAAGSVTVFEVTGDGKLRFVEANRGSEDCFNEVRGVAMQPKGAFLAAVSTKGSVVLLERNAVTGKTRIAQKLPETAGKGERMDGLIQAAFSPDGGFLYTSAGRFTGRTAIRAYKLNPDGKLALANEVFGGEDHLDKFVGANGLAVSPDGLNVYAVATQSGALACLRRDTNSGKIEAAETISLPNNILAGAAGVDVSPDGRFVYAAVENHVSIAIFQRLVK